MSGARDGLRAFRSEAPRTRKEFHEAQGVLLVVRDPPPPPPPTPGQPPAVPGNPAEGVEILLALWDDGSVTALSGHVDLGTGIRTALAQIAADELDVALDQVNMVLGDTARAPNQGPTIASASIQIQAVPLREAAAQARAWLVARAGERLGVEVADLAVERGIAQDRSKRRRIAYGALVAGQHVELVLACPVHVKTPEEHRLVGESVARVDIPAKATGELVYVHDMRVPGMLHGRVVRPPYAGADHGDFIGNSLESVDESSIAHVPGIVSVVVIRDFVGIVAEREEQAEQAMRELELSWKPTPGLPELSDLARALRANPATPRVVADQGNVDAALAQADVTIRSSYVWPYQMHASIGPSCALADWRGDTVAVWAGSQYPHALRADLATLTGLADTAIEVIRMEASGCYGRNCADDVAADAVLLSRAVGRPVRVQLSREQENLWEPKGAAQLMEVAGGLDAQGGVAAYDFRTFYPSNGAVPLALLLTGAVDPGPTVYEMGDRTAVPPYDFHNLRVTVNDMAPILRASWLRGVSALPNSFAHESYIDELSTVAGVDPVEFRLRYLHDRRAVELIGATVERAGWIRHTKPQQQAPEGDLLKGQGFAYARYVHSRFPGFGAAWAAWVADVEVNRLTGEVNVSRVVVGQDAGLVINPAGVRHQLHGNVVQTTSRALKEKLPVDLASNFAASREWGSYPILNFREVPVIDVLMMPRPGEPPLGVGESSSVPGTAAIANAIFDATGVRFRAPPFTSEVVRAALNPLPAPQADGTQVPAAPHGLPQRSLPPDAPWPRRRGFWPRAGALAAAVLGLAAAALGWRPAIAPVAGSQAQVYTAALIERGRQLAAAGDCVVCHTAPGGTPNAGGQAMDTPFGTVITTNLTPDAETGIGSWSFSAFQRAMREGISRDGRHLYPAFPYTAFTKVSDEDLTAIYTYLMAQPAQRNAVPETKLAFPFSLRPLVAFWNALYLDPGPQAQNSARSAEWNRGAYLVNGLGHCGACHTARNAMGAEQEGKAFLGGAIVEEWEAPPLTVLNHAPVPWTTDDFYHYLRFGYSAQHGSATGPMAPVVRELAATPDADVRAMAQYLASFSAEASSEEASTIADTVVAQGKARHAILAGAAQRLFIGACGACHHDGEGPLTLGRNLPLALSSKLHSARPDNLLRVVLEGIREPASSDLGFMPAFLYSLSDEQIAQIASYMRARYAPRQPPWPGDLAREVARLREAALRGR